MGRKLTAIIFLMTMPLTNLYAADSKNTIRILIRPECKTMFYGPDFEIDGKIESRPKPDYVDWDPTHAKPLAFKDPRTLITFYVESDGRHLAAMNSNGKLLWVRNPFEDAGLCPYRSPRPVIYRIEAADTKDITEEMSDLWFKLFKQKSMDISHRFIRIFFDSSQYGIVDESSGGFMPEGQN